MVTTKALFKRYKEEAMEAMDVYEGDMKAVPLNSLDWTIAYYCAMEALICASVDLRVSVTGVA